MRFILFLLVFLSMGFALNVEVSNTNIANGKTLFIEFKKEKNVQYENVTLDKKVYKIFQNPLDKSKYYAFVPINYYEKPSDKKLKVHFKKSGKQKSEEFKFHIEDAKYEKETLIVDNSKVQLSKKDKKRASKEYAEAMKIYKSATLKSYIASEFVTPLNSMITSDFGKARVYNGTLKSYHGGTDFRADNGTPLKASNSGKVVLAKDRFYSGLSVVIDHGHGIYSCYFHLSKALVKKGSIVKKGDVIGLSGSSGRVTGPHLHFGIRVGGEQVDPLQFIELINKKLFTKNS